MNYEITFKDYKQESQIVNELQYNKIRKQVYAGKQTHVYINDELYGIKGIGSITKTSEKTKVQKKKEKMNSAQINNAEQQNKDEWEAFEKHENEYVTKHLNEIYGVGKWSRFPAQYVKNRDITIIPHSDTVHILETFITEFPRYRKFYASYDWSHDLNL